MKILLLTAGLLPGLFVNAQSAPASAGAPQAVQTGCANAEKCAWECEQKQQYLSCYRLGSLYASGNQVQKSASRAADYYRKACELGDGYICALLGWELRYGATLEHNPARADEANRIGCDKGILSACLAAMPRIPEPAQSRPAASTGEPAALPDDQLPPSPVPPRACRKNPSSSAAAPDNRPITVDRSNLQDAASLVEESALPERLKRLKGEAPKYPDPGLQQDPHGRYFVQGMSGNTIFNIIVDEHGNVTHPIILCTDSLRKSVYELDSLKTWHYPPPKLDGKPVKVKKWVTIIREIETHNE